MRPRDIAKTTDTLFCKVDSDTGKLPIPCYQITTAVGNTADPITANNSAWVYGHVDTPYYFTVPNTYPQVHYDGMYQGISGRAPDWRGSTIYSSTGHDKIYYQPSITIKNIPGYINVGGDPWGDYTTYYDADDNPFPTGTATASKAYWSASTQTLVPGWNSRYYIWTAHYEIENVSFNIRAGFAPIYSRVDLGYINGSWRYQYINLLEDLYPNIFYLGDGRFRVNTYVGTDSTDSNHYIGAIYDANVVNIPHTLYNDYDVNLDLGLRYLHLGIGVPSGQTISKDGAYCTIHRSAEQGVAPWTLFYEGTLGEDPIPDTVPDEVISWLRLYSPISPGLGGYRLHSYGKLSANIDYHNKPLNPVSSQSNYAFWTKNGNYLTLNRNSYTANTAANFVYVTPSVRPAHYKVNTVRLNQLSEWSNEELPDDIVYDTFGRIAGANLDTYTPSTTGTATPYMEDLSISLSTVSLSLDLNRETLSSGSPTNILSPTFNRIESINDGSVKLWYDIQDLEGTVLDSHEMAQCYANVIPAENLQTLFCGNYPKPYVEGVLFENDYRWASLPVVDLAFIQANSRANTGRDVQSAVSGTGAWNGTIPASLTAAGGVRTLGTLNAIEQWFDLPLYLYFAYMQKYPTSTNSIPTFRFNVRKWLFDDTPSPIYDPADGVPITLNLAGSNLTFTCGLFIDSVVERCDKTLLVAFYHPVQLAGWVDPNTTNPTGAIMNDDGTWSPG